MSSATEHFDPYRKWLGIPEKDQPPHHYRLLGIELFEDDPDVIESAADARMSHLRTFQTGKRSELSQKILNEVAAAKVVLLDADKRQAYDAELREQQAPPPSSKPPAPSPPAPRPPEPRPPEPRPPEPRPPVPRPPVPRPPAVTFAPERPTSKPPAAPAPPPGSAIPGVVARDSGNGAPPEHIGVSDGAGIGGPSPGASASIMRSKPRRKSGSFVVLTFLIVGGLGILLGGGALAFVLTGAWGRAVAENERDSSNPSNRNDGQQGNPPGTPKDTSSTDPAQSKAGDDPSVFPPGSSGANGSNDGGTEAIPSDASDGGIVGLPDPTIPAGRQQIDATQAAVDLVGHFEPDADVVAGRWRAINTPQPGIATWGREPLSAIALPCQLPEHYRLEVRVRSLGRDGATLYIGLPRRNARFCAVFDKPVTEQIDGQEKLFSGLELVDGKPVEANGTGREGRVFSGTRRRDLGRRESRMNPGNWSERFPSRTLVVACVGEDIILAGDDGEITRWRGTDNQLSLARPAESIGNDRVFLAIHRPGGGGGGLVVSRFRIEPIENPLTYVLPQIVPDAPDDPATADRGERSSIPSSSDQQAAQEKVEEVFRAQVERAATDEARSAIAEAMYQAAADEDDSAALRFVLLNEARKLAAAQADVELAFAAVEDLLVHFDVPDPLQLKTQTFSALSSAASTSEKRILVAEALLEFAEELVGEDNYEPAAQSLRSAANLAVAARNTELGGTARSRLAEVESLAEKWNALKAQRGVLDADPDNAAAALALGRFLAFIKGDWPRGADLLARLADHPLGSLAREDLSSPPDADQQVALADAWRETADTLLNEEIPEAVARAMYWYEQALPQLSGIERERVAAILSGKEPSTQSPESLREQVKKIKGLAVRHHEHRQLLLEYYGGSDETEEAVAAGLKWLEKHQLPAGMWSFNHQLVGDRGGVSGNPGNLAEAVNNATGIALMPILASGATHKEGRFKGTIERAFGFLTRRVQLTAAGGSFREKQGDINSHSRCTMVLCNDFAMTKDRRMLAGVQQAVKYALAAQSAKDGGWGKMPDEHGDMYRTYWSVRALLAAEYAGVKIPQANLDRIGRFLNRMEDEEEGFFYERCDTEGNRNGRARPGMVWQCKLATGTPINDERLQEAAALLAKRGPSKGDVLHNLSATELLFQVGGEPWQTWNEKLIEYLLKEQSQAGHEKGSWFYESDASAAGGGRLFHTALTTLMLQSYYREPNRYRDEEASE